MATTRLLRGLSSLGGYYLKPMVIFPVRATVQTPRIYHGNTLRIARYTTSGAGNSENVESLPSTDDRVNSTDKAAEIHNNTNGNGVVVNGNGIALPEVLGDGTSTDWSKSYYGLSSQPFTREVAEVLEKPIEFDDIEVKPDGLLYLPEIKYRRVLNKAFGPGGWGLAPRSETNVGPKIVSREYALVCLGRLVAIARGEQEYFDPSGIPTATEACKSNALMRCCKDLGIASELWDPRFIREFKAKYCIEVFAEHVPTKKKKKLWRRRDGGKFEYPWKE